MTDLKQAAQQALEAWFRPHGINYVDFKPYMEALKQALAEPEQEPVAWEQFYPDIGKPQTTHWEGCEAVHPECRKPEPVVQLEFKGTLPISRGGYAPTPRRPLTEGEMPTLFVGGLALNSEATKEIVRAVEKAHGIGEQDA